MKLAISNIAWSDDSDYYYPLMKKYNFDGLEIAPTKFSVNPYDQLETIRTIKKKLLQEYNLQIVSMQALLFGTSGLELFSTKESRDNLLAYLKKAIVYAGEIECKVLVFGNPKNRVINNIKTDYGIAVDFFSALGDFAVKHNTCFCIEPNPKEYGTNFINTLEEANQLVNLIQNPGFKMIADTSTMLINNNNPEDILPVLDNVKHIHISLPFLKPLNQEFINHEDWILSFVNIVKNSGYNKYVSLEMINAGQHDVEASLILLDNMRQNHGQK